MAPSPALSYAPDLDLTRDALASSTLNHGLMVLGERWTMAVMMGAFTGVNRFDDWQTRLGIPRPTLANRLKTLVALGLMRQRVYQERPRRMAYHLTAAGMKLYPHVLMVWLWEQRWGSRRSQLPDTLFHKTCGHRFVPTLTCAACGDKVGINDLQLTLKPNARLLAQSARAGRAARLASQGAASMGLGLRVDRWSLMIVTAVVLGCHYFDQLVHVLGIASSVLARRLSGMVEAVIGMSAEPTLDGIIRHDVSEPPKIMIRTRKKTIVPRSATQSVYMEELARKDMIFALGPAGTGKTYLAVAQAVSQLITGSVDRLILSRPAVEAGERLGFLPGDMKEKVDPYLRPLYDALYDTLPAEQVERRIASGEIEIAPLAFMRGRTLANAFIILDEAQNTTQAQMKMFLTRFGEGSRMVICGDPKQVDLPTGGVSGLGDAVDRLEGVDGIAIVRFSAADVVRHPIVGRIVQAYEGPDS